MPSGVPQVPPELLRPPAANAPSTAHLAPRRWWFERFLVDDWRLAWRFSSVQLASALALLTLLQTAVLPLYEFAIPPRAWQWVMALGPTVIVVLRLLRQASLDRERAQAAQVGVAPSGVAPTGVTPTDATDPGDTHLGITEAGAPDPAPPNGGPQ